MIDASKRLKSDIMYGVSDDIKEIVRHHMEEAGWNGITLPESINIAIESLAYEVVTQVVGEEYEEQLEEPCGDMDDFQEEQ